MSTRVLLFKTNSGWDLCMEFKMRKKEKYKRAEKFTKKIKKST